jgi:molybdopterin synthase sulfur carrier subunit
MKVRVRYFASLRERLGAEELVELAEGSSVGALRAALVARGDAYAEVLAPGRAVRCALNQRMCSEAETLAEAAEVAFFPPVTGG